jgi:uncharacterized protein YlxP (DUF503 family)
LIVGTLEVDLRLDGCFSLKDKRRILRAMLDRIRRELPVAAAEVGDTDLWNRATLGFGTVGGDAGVVETALQRVEERIAASAEVEIVQIQRHIERT